MRALECSPTIPAYAAARMTGRVRGGPLSLLRLSHRPPPALPGPGWVRLVPRLSGICGSDLAVLGGHASPYLAALASTPFVPGHEIVADVAEGEGEGSRVVVEPLLSCVVRGIDPPCPSCAAGEPQHCESVAGDGLAAGLQTGYCSATGGGWATELIAHASQLHAVPDRLDDADAVMVEPLACAVHATSRTLPRPGERAVVLGAGTVGLLVVAALAAMAPRSRLLAVAKHDHQRRHATRLGAESVCAPDALLRTVRFLCGARLVEPRIGDPFLLGGADVVYECTGTATGLRDAISCTRPQGTVVMVGMLGRVTVDLAPAWHRELNLRGAYGYGTETDRRTFDMALELAGRLHPGRLLDQAYPLEDYRAAVAHAAAAGSRGAVKLAFRPQPAATGEHR